MKLSELQGMSMMQIRQLPAAVKKDLYGKLRKQVQRRSETFRKHGMKAIAPRSLRNMKPAGKTSMSKIDSALGLATTYRTADIYTYSGYNAWESSQRSTLAEQMGVSSMSSEDYRSYKGFLDDMSRRMKDQWKYASKQAVELYAAARRLNLKPEQFKRNFDYWAAHAHKLKDATPISRGSGVKPSDYIKQLNLESVTSWKAGKK